MKNTMKKMLSFLLVAVMLITMVPIISTNNKALASSKTHSVTLTYDIEDAAEGNGYFEVYYFPYNSDGSLNMTKTLYGNRTIFTETDESYNCSKTISGIPGWPCEIYFQVNGKSSGLFSSYTYKVKVTSLKIDKTTVVTSNYWITNPSGSSVNRFFIWNYDGSGNDCDFMITSRNWNLPENERFPTGYDYTWDKYSFSNLDETISSDIYKKGYGNIKGKILHAIYENGENHGHCYGMTSTSAALLSNPRAVSCFKSPYIDYYVVKMHELFPEYTSDLFGDDLRTFIKYGYIYQFDKDVQSSEKASKNDLRNLYNSVNAYVNGNNNPVIINVYHDSFLGRKDGHSVLAVGIKETTNEYIILINDSNIYYEKQEFKISKDFSSWSYNVDSFYEYSSNNGHFTYSFPANVIYNVGLLLNENGSSFMSADNNLISSTKTICSDSDLEEILPATGSNQDNNNSNCNLYWLKEENKKTKITSLSDDNEVTVSDTETSLQIILSNNDEAEFYVNDEDNSTVIFDASINNEIILTTYGDNTLIETKITGTTNNTEITATQTATGLLVTGISDGTVTLSKDDKVIATEEIKDAESDIEINYDTDGSDDDLEVKYHVHSYKETITTPPTCTEAGVITHACACGDNYTEAIPETGHKDADGDYICDNNCGYEYEKPDDPTSACSHMCHKTGFIGFIWKILRVFFKLFGTNPVCECGISHY